MCMALVISILKTQCITQRKYNSCFKTISFSRNKYRGRNIYMSTLNVQWRIYHRDWSVLPLSDAERKFPQIYFIRKTDHRIDQRR